MEKERRGIGIAEGCNEVEFLYRSARWECWRVGRLYLSFQHGEACLEIVGRGESALAALGHPPEKCQSFHGCEVCDALRVVGLHLSGEAVRGIKAACLALKVEELFVPDLLAAIQERRERSALGYVLRDLVERGRHLSGIGKNAVEDWGMIVGPHRPDVQLALKHADPLCSGWEATGDVIKELVEDGYLPRANWCRRESGVVAFTPDPSLSDYTNKGQDYCLIGRVEFRFATAEGGEVPVLRTSTATGTEGDRWLSASLSRERACWLDRETYPNFFFDIEGFDIKEWEAAVAKRGEA